MNSILTSVKKMLGIEEAYEQFDPELILDINAILMILTQLGVGPDSGFFISDKSQLWTDFLGDRKDIEAVKTFVYLRVRLLFDPPTNAFLVEAMERQVREIEWRLNIQVDKPQEPIIVVEEGGI